MVDDVIIAVVKVLRSIVGALLLVDNQTQYLVPPSSRLNKVVPHLLTAQPGIEDSSTSRLQ